LLNAHTAILWVDENVMRWTASKAYGMVWHIRAVYLQKGDYILY